MSGDSMPVDKIKALSLWQPWASLIAIGAKAIETRSWSTSYRGPLAIHAAARPPTASDFEDTIPGRAGWIGAYNLGRWTDDVVHADPCDCDEDEEHVGERCMAASAWDFALFDGNASHAFALPLVTTLPLGAIVATCTLADVVPMVDGDRWDEQPHHALVLDGDRLVLFHPSTGDTDTGALVTGQRPYGDFAPGRYAWLLEDITPCEPVPAKGKQGLWAIDFQAEQTASQGEVPGA